MFTTRGVMDASNGKMAMADGVGEFLRRERELRYISLDDVAERTKISRRYLEAIEEGQYDRLPGETFVRGFIRSYAQSVGLDPEDTLLRYNQARIVHGGPAAPNRAPIPGKARVECALLAVALAGGGSDHRWCACEPCGYR